MNWTSILIYHRVIKEFQSIIPNPDSLDFSAKLSIIENFGSNCSCLKDSLNLNEGNIFKRNFIVTFDDGYADNVDVAMPLLMENFYSATFFIASGYLDGGWMWNDGIIEAISKTNKNYLDLVDLSYEKYSLKNVEDKVRCINDLLGKIKYLAPLKREDLAKRILEVADVAEPTHLMMTSEQVKKMHAAGMEIGGHTVSHPILSSIDKATARNEIHENKEFLESLIGEPLHSFAYPNGIPGKDYGPEHVQMVKEAGYKCAVSTKWGRVDNNSDLFQLPRFTPWDRNPLKFMLRLYLQRF
jgi:peptidoglycan/xylan/chitin deacetylase (PgdA/CDA1 family)